MKPKKIFDQYELMTRPLDGGTHEVLGLKCVWCSEVVMSAERARAFYPIFAMHRNPVQGIMATMGLQTIELVLHWLGCKAPLGN